jgi:UDP-glucose 4-epimerase
MGDQGFRRILVTGGCGFIGSHLVDRLLAEGCEVRVLDDLSSGTTANLNHHAVLIQGSVLDEAALAHASEGIDACYHLAAVASVSRSVDRWRESTAVNLSGSVAVFELCARLGVPVVYASSAAVYGVPARLPLTEDAPARPISPYGVDKLAMEWHARAGGTCRGLRSVGLRFFNVFGTRQDPASPYSGVISVFVDRARRGDDLSIYGDGQQTRDFIHVDDVVSALCLASAAASTAAPVFNVARGQEMPIAELAELIIRLGRSHSLVRYEPARAGDVVRSCGDSKALSHALGWFPQVSVARGLASLLGPGERP